MQGAGELSVVAAGNDNLVALNGSSNLLAEHLSQSALRALDGDFLTVDLNVNACGDNDRLLTDS